MDPYRFGYSPIVERPRLGWPNNARVAVWVCPNIEHYEYLPAEVRVRNPWPRMPHPDVLGYGGRDYGNRVGLWRMFDVLDKHSVRCTVSLSMSVIEMYPEILEAMEQRRWEYMSHGYFNTRYHWGYSEEEEREVIEHSKATHLRLTGRKLRGWFSPAVSNTLATPDLVKEAGHLKRHCQGRAFLSLGHKSQSSGREEDIPFDRARKCDRLLEDNANAPPEIVGVDCVGADVPTVEENLPPHAKRRRQVDQAVEAPEQGRFSGSRSSKNHHQAWRCRLREPT